MSDKQVLVVGGGPVGFLTALGLARAGIRVSLVEAEPEIVDSPRAMVYHWSVLEGLDRLGVLDDARKTGFVKQEFSHWVFRTNERINWSLDALDPVTPYPYNLHLGQNELARIAWQHLERLPGTSVRFGTRISGLSQDASGVSVTLQTPQGPVEERYDWVIGADGGGSTVREKLLKLNFFGITHPERFIATNVRHDFRQHGFLLSNLTMDPVYGAIIVRIDDSDLWRITVMEDASLPLDGVPARMDAFYRTYAPGIGDYELVQYSPYRMHQRCADTMRVGRVVLAGDAAHITNPTGGLGLTSGLFDVYHLLEVMTAILLEGASEDHLDTYSDRRRQMFIERASPQAVANKRLIFHAYQDSWLEERLAFLRRLPHEPDVVRQMAGFTKTLETHMER